MAISPQLKQELRQAIEEANVGRAEEIIAAAECETSAREVLLTLVEPVLTSVGEDWEKRSMVLAQGYLAAKLSERVLERVLAESPQLPSQPHETAVLGNIEDDFHALGRRMVGQFLRAAGWEVHDLGNDVPVETFIEEARASGARVIGASAMMYTTARNISRLREALDREALSGRIQLAVGGAVFNLRPELVTEVGGDGTARSAVLAPALFSQLAARAQAWGTQ